MRLLTITTAIVLASGCGSGDSRQAVPTRTESSELVDRVTLYRSLSAPPTSGAWAYPDSCDGLLFSALTAVGRSEPIDIEAAQGEIPGQWYRNPSRECYPGSSASDISRDMVLGLVIYSVHFGRLDILEGLWSYGSARHWVMGRGDSRAVLTPSSVGRLARAIHYLGGADRPERYVLDIPSRTAGYQGHLALLGILLDGKMAGRVSTLQLSDLRHLVQVMPGNPLAQALLHKYTDGDQTLATDLLLRTWPEDRLPDSTDWCEPWRTQRTDTDPGLHPCGDGSTHTGGDFLLVAALLLGEI